MILVNKNITLNTVINNYPNVIINDEQSKGKPWGHDTQRAFKILNPIYVIRWSPFLKCVFNEMIGYNVYYIDSACNMTRAKRRATVAGSAICRPAAGLSRL